MADIYYVPEEQGRRISFSEAPAHNIVNTICLLKQDHVSGISHWIDSVRTRLTEDEKRRAGIACRASAYFSLLKPETLDELLRGLRDVEPEALIAYQMKHLLDKARGLGITSVPTEQELRESEERFLDLVRRILEKKDIPFEEADERDEYRKVMSGDLGREMADSIEYFWNTYLASEWPNAESQIRESVRAFNTVTLPEGTLEERLKFVTGRDNLPPDFVQTLSEAEEIVYVPSAHIGPYLILFTFDGTTAYLVGRARKPEGARTVSNELDRSELLMRLEAVSDGVRLAMLEQAAKEPITTASVMETLQLSQSSASRHLTQLAATGLLAVDASERTKKFSVNTKRIEELCDHLRAVTGSSPRQ